MYFSIFFLPRVETDMHFKANEYFTGKTNV